MGAWATALLPLGIVLFIIALSIESSRSSYSQPPTAVWLLACAVTAVGIGLAAGTVYSLARTIQRGVAALERRADTPE